MSLKLELPKKTGFILCGHGSRNTDAQTQFKQLAEQLLERANTHHACYGFLEIVSPNLPTALDFFTDKDVEHLYVLPLMLFNATHVLNDIPSIAKNHPIAKEKRFTFLSAIGLMNEMVEAFADTIKQTLSRNNAQSDDCLLLIVGRGTSVPEANAEAAFLTRLMKEKLGFPWAEVFYTGAVRPNLSHDIDKAISLGFSKIMIAPYILYPGRLYDDIQTELAQIAAQYQEHEFLLSEPLNNHPGVLKALIKKLENSIHD